VKLHSLTGIGAPFVATMVDVTGLVIHFSVAIVILHGTLL
jgi:magnesium transporter